MSLPEILKVVEEGYLKASFIERDTEAMACAFHRDFVMFIRESGQTVSLSQFQDFVRSFREKTPVVDARFTWDMEILDVTGHTAVIKVQVFKDLSLIYTDYLCMYKINDAWQIISKIFESH